MVILALPSSLENFEGRVNHTAVAGQSETIVFVSPLGSERYKANITACLKGIAENLEAVPSPSQKTLGFNFLHSYFVVSAGEAYIAKVGGLLERAHIIRRPTPTRFQIYLLDQGFQDEVEYTDLFEYPEELLSVGAFTCICPVLVSSDELPKVDNNIIDRKCICIVEGVAKSVVVFGFVKGKLSVENVNGLADSKKDALDSRSFESFDSSTFDGRSLSSTSDSFSESELIYSFNVVAYSRGDLVRDLILMIGCTKKTMKCLGAVPVRQIGAFFKQSAFKGFSPEGLPTVINVRFDKMDRLYSTFWVVNAKTFSTVEQVLKGSAKRLSRCPNLTVTGEGLAESVPCVVRTRTDSPFKEFYRAVPIRFDSSSKRFSIFLVDFGWFKWVVANDVYDISILDEVDPVRNLPVALIHCREVEEGSLHAKDLTKGRECRMVIKERDSKNICSVSLYDVSEKPVLAGNSFSLHNDEIVARDEEEKLPSNVADLTDISSCRKLINDVCVQQLKVSLMMETLSTCPTNYNQSWAGPGLYPSTPVLPTFMPVVPMPLIMPLQSSVTGKKGVMHSGGNAESGDLSTFCEDKNQTSWSYRQNESKKSWEFNEGCSYNTASLKRHKPGFSPGQKNNHSIYNHDRNQGRYVPNSSVRQEREGTDVRVPYDGNGLTVIEFLSKLIHADGEKGSRWDRISKRGPVQHQNDRKGIGIK
ncbi:unnamed protein product [Enterobius vermicularis]|uniref:Tudor domain-containing protein n=1 Tax=Enterobius vermicularis TaxID=51028 RepID=A0A0N4V3V2_ENTVE|nr:unnamed protein product [Enterobius vermicularis]